jgi:hypothetical protein
MHRAVNLSRPHFIVDSPCTISWNTDVAINYIGNAFILVPTASPMGVVFLLSTSRSLPILTPHTHTLINSALHHATFWQATIRSSESNFRAPESPSQWQQLFLLFCAHDYMWSSRMSFFKFTWVAKPTKCMWKLWTLYSHITITILDIIHRYVLYLKLNSTL